MTFATGPFTLGPVIPGPFVAGPFGNKLETFPTLDLNFAALTTGTTDGRSSSWWNLMKGGTTTPDEFIDASTGALTYGPHNLLSFSGDFTQSGWSKTSCTVVVNAGTAPDGSDTAQLVRDAAATGTPQMIQDTAGVAPIRSAFSWVKASGRNFAYFGMAGPGIRAVVYVNLTTGAITQENFDGSTKISTSVVAGVNGWFLVSVSASSSNFSSLRVAPSLTGFGTNSGELYAGDGASGILVWGPQLNLGPLQPYVPTTATPVYSTVPRITYSGASLATVIGPTGQVQWKPHNLLTQSQSFSDWTKANSTVALNSAISPQGISDASLVYPNTTGVVSNPRLITNINSGQIGQVYTVSVYAKAAGKRWLFLSAPDATNSAQHNCWFDLIAGQPGSIGSGSTAAMTAVGNGWYRISVSSIATQITQYCYISSPDANGLTTVTNSGTDGAYLWGAQLNVGPLQPYYPTTSAAYFCPRLTHDPVTFSPVGLLVEEQRTNLVANSSAVGASVVGNGTLPTGWSAANSGGLGLLVVGAGTEGGLPYVDVRIQGTTANAQGFNIDVAATPFSILPNVLYTASSYIRIVAGSLSGISSIDTYLDQYNSSDGLIAGGAITSPAFTPTSGSLLSQRRSHTFTSHSLASKTNFRVFWARILSGTTVDVTLRIAAPQFEAGAFATSYIPTSGTSVVRLADSASMTGTNFSSWFNPTQGAFAVSNRHTQSSNVPATINLGPQATNVGLNGGLTESWWNTTTNVTTVNSVAIGSLRRSAFSYTEGTRALVLNAGSVVSDTNAPWPAPRDSLRFGATTGASQFINATIARIRYFNTALPAATLQHLTAA